MRTIDQLKESYDQLDHNEKARLGESLVKVNLGVGLPDDLKRVAAFLKGSHLIAKAGELDSLVNSLHRHEENSLNNTSDQTQILVSRHMDFGKTQVKNVSTFDEDSEVTHKDKLS